MGSLGCRAKRRFSAPRAIWRRFRGVLPVLGGLNATLMEDQAAHVVSEVGERQFCLGLGKADRADGEAEVGFLMRKDVLDGSSDGRLLRIGLRHRSRHGLPPAVICFAQSRAKPVCRVPHKTPRRLRRPQPARLRQGRQATAR